MTCSLVAYLLPWSGFTFCLSKYQKKETIANMGALTFVQAEVSEYMLGCLLWSPHNAR